MESLMQLIRNMGTARLAMLGAVLGGVILFFYAIIGSVSTASMTTLYTDLDPSSAASISQQLTAENIPHSSDATGRTILVPSDQVGQLRLRFASEGLSGGVIGKEIFDGESSFGRTSFELNVNYVRAIEGELTKTIKSIRGVSEARVHVVMPERRPFQREESSPSASILLQTSGAIGSGQAQAIQALVASAVPGLSAERITITDTNGRLLADGAGDSEVSSFNDLEEARLTKERIYRTKIEDLIGSVVGRGMVRAEVSISMDMDRTTTSQTRFDPDGQVVLSSETTEEQSEEPLPGGQTTVANNIPGAQGGEGPDNSTESSKTRETTNFENSKTETVTVREPGRITQVLVSVLVDHQRTVDAEGLTTATAERDPAEIQQIFNLVKTALPPVETADGTLVPVPDDNITVAQMRFVDPVPIEATEDPFISLFGLNQQFILDIARYGVTGLISLLVIFLIIKPIVSKVIESIPAPAPPSDPALEDKTPETPAIAAPGAPITAEIMAAAAAGDEDAAAAVLAAREAGALVPGQMRTDTKIDVAQVEGRIQESAIKKVSEIIKSNPAESVAIVRTWLYAE